MVAWQRKRVAFWR